MNVRILHWKRAVLPVLFTLLLSVAGVTNALAQSFTVGDLNYSMNDDGASVTVTGHVDGQNATGELVIPESVELYGTSYPVTVIGSYAFNNCSGLTGSLVIPNSVIYIGEYAFHYCTGFNGSLTLGDAVQIIGYAAFHYCSGFTGSLILGNAVQSIEGDAFSYCSGFTGSLTLGDAVQSIGSYAFANCGGFTGLLTIPESVTQIRYGAFRSCNFTSLNYNAVNCYLYGSDWGGYHWLEYCSSMTTLNIGENVQVIPSCFLYNRTSFTGELVIPNSVTTIGNSAFNGCTGFTGSLNIGNSVTSIGENAFNGCNGFTGSLTIPNAVTTIGNSAFLNCTGFSGTLTLGQSLTEIGNSAFFGACEGFTAFNVWAEVPPTLGTNVFLSVNTGIPVYVSCGTLEAYQNASGWSNFTNLQETNPCMWEISATTNPAIGGTVSGTGTYEQGQTCTLTATALSDFEFSRWTENGVEVSTDAVYSFTVESHRNLVAHFTNPNYIDFVDPIVEARCIELWDSDGDGFLSYDEAAAVTSLNYAFQNWDNITSFDELQYFTGLTYIDNWEMAGCGNLTSIILPENLTSINYAAFEYSYALQSIVIPENVNYIGGWAFSYCYALTSIIMQAATPPNISDDCPFCYTDMSNIVVTVPCGATSSYHNAYIWSDFGNYQEPDDCIYEITVTLNHDEAGTVSGTGAYQNGATCTLTATANQGCSFLNWSENGQVVSTEASYSFVVTGNRALVANFSLPTYTITATANPTEGGSVITDQDYSFEDGTLQGWTAIDADGDGRNWYVRNDSYGDSFDLYGHSGSYLVASFSYYGGPINPDNYLISPEVSNANSIHYYVAGQPDYRDHYGVYVSTTGNNLSDFFLVFEETIPASKDGMEGDNLMKAKERNRNVSPTPWFERTIELPQGTKYVAFRHFNSYDMYFVLLDDISISSDEGGYVYEQGQTCTMTAIPNYGYAFANWTENGNIISTDAELSFTVTSDRDLVANFVQTPFTINATPNFDDRGTVSGSGEYVINQTCTLTATPNEGHNFAYWMENGGVVSTEASYSFTVAGPRDLVAVFTAHVDDIIVFADPDTKYVCVNNWDTDGDGELTYDEAAAVTDLWGFYDNYDINSFDELQYFTGLSYISDWAFEYCYYLSSIIIPNTVTSIGSYAFQHCGSLSSIVMPNSVTSIGYAAFYECYSLTNIVLPENLSSIGNEAFHYCSGLRGELTLPESLVWVGEYAFASCDEITTVNYNATNCSVMGNTQHPVFYDCLSLEHINIGENVESIPNYAFKRCNDIIEINVAAVVPPTVGVSTFATISHSIPVYVPCGTSAAYQSASVWNEFTNIQEDCSQIQTQTVTLSQGWNWFSTYIEADDLLQQLEASLGENGLYIESSELLSTEYLDGEWIGDLDEVGISNEQMYLIQTSSDCTIQLQGLKANPVNHAITINPEWNWVGYPCSEEMTIAEALAGFAPEDGDRIENMEDYAEYLDGEWLGLETLKPGQGFLYYSNSTTTKTFTFPVGAK